MIVVSGLLGFEQFCLYLGFEKRRLRFRTAQRVELDIGVAEKVAEY